MAATLQYQAGIETNQTQFSYAVETDWGIAPAVPFQAIRYMSDTLALTKTRQRPSEINITREASQAVTTQQQAGGTIAYALSYATYDDFFSSLFQNDWSVPYAIASAGADVTITSDGSNTLVLSSNSPTKYTDVAVGQYVRLSGFANTNYNSWWRVSAKTANNHVTLVGFTVAAGTETSAGTNILITGSTLKNGTIFKTLFLQQKFSNNKYLRYGGCYVTRITLTANVGAFFTGAIDLVAQSEVASVVEASTGATVPSPSGTVLDPVAGYVRMTYKDSPNTMAGNIDQLAMTLENTGAAPEFTLGGSAGAAGMLGGTFTASGTFRMYCKDFQLYDLFKSEASGDMQFFLQDAQRNSYVFSFQDVVFMCRITAGGPGQAVMVEVTFEGNPDAAVGGTVQIDRHPTPN